MKKSLLGLALAALFANTAHAQLHSRSSSFAGIKVGGSAATFVGDDAKDMQHVFGFNAGLFASLTLSQPFSLQPELLYSMKGAQTPAGYLTQSTVWLNYIDLPVAFRATTKDGLFAEAGPQIGFLINAKSDATGEKVNVKSAYNSVDFGFVAGVGYQPSKGGLGVGARYNMGLQNVLKNQADGNPAAGNDKSNSVFQLYITYSRPAHHNKAKRKEK